MNVYGFGVHKKLSTWENLEIGNPSVFGQKVGCVLISALKK
jgi:hypothetical protein